MNLRSFLSVKDRREALEKESGMSMSDIGTFTLDESIASTRNCENMIGAIQIPLGVVGPLKLTTHSSSPTTEYYVPLATTEGALVASVNRGCKVVTQAGGAFVACERVGTTRGPVFRTESLQQSFLVKRWIEEHLSDLNTTAQTTSTHIKLLSSLVHIEGSLVFVRLGFDTQDAMGMNMATIATEAIGKLIQQATSATFLSVSGNFCVDKKASWQNMILGRGFRAWAEVVLPTTLVTDVLKTSVESLYELWEVKCLIGGTITGTIGANGHAANVIAALYLATGQDLAHVVEGSMAVTTMKIVESGIAVSVSLPSLLVGTVGGGTGLATQKEALSLLGIANGNEGQNAWKLSTVVAGTVLAGEISELAALSSHTLVCAHQKLGRGK